jgi:hypothetical protein
VLKASKVCVCVLTRGVPEPHKCLKEPLNRIVWEGKNKMVTFGRGGKKIIVIFIIPDTCLIQHVYASACACMCTLSTASSDAPSSTSTRTVSACPRQLANSNAVERVLCEHSQVSTVQKSIGLDEREHVHEYIYTCQYMRIYTRTSTSPRCVEIHLKQKCS